ncbi:MAG: hypothetical protein IT361_00150 [Gemmatimonadaceae bacterium]|nr:hypothetical protein [Gemmatimonadaceae bacterium]
MFKFPLQRLLALKARKEQEMARQLAVARLEVRVEEERRDALANLQNAGTEQVAAGTESALSVGELVNMRHALAQVEEHLAVAEERTDAARQVEAEKNQALSSAVQDRQMLDRLRDRRLEQHKAAESQGDRAAMDAIGLTRFNATRSGEHQTTNE